MTCSVNCPTSSKAKTETPASVVVPSTAVSARMIASPSRPFWRIQRSLPEPALVDLAKIFASISVERWRSSAETGL